MLGEDPCDRLEPWLRSLSPRSEAVARMAFRLAFEEVRRNRRFMSRIIELTCVLRLSGDELQTLREEAAQVAAQLDRASLREPAAGEDAAD